MEGPYGLEGGWKQVGRGMDVGGCAAGLHGSNADDVSGAFTTLGETLGGGANSCVGSSAIGLCRGAAPIASNAR